MGFSKTFSSESYATSRVISDCHFSTVGRTAASGGSFACGQSPSEFGKIRLRACSWTVINLACQAIYAQITKLTPNPLATVFDRCPDPHC